MRNKKKNLVKKAGIGASLLMSSVLLCGNTVKAHAQAEPTPEVPVTPVEPVENQTTNNTTEQKTETAKEQSSTTDIQSSKKIIETGARTNILLSFSMAVAALFTGLFL